MTMTRPSFVRALALAAVAVLVFGVSGRAQDPYRKPPKEILDILDARQPPVVSLSPTGDMMMLVEPVRYPSIAELAEPMLRLAGLRINPNTNGPHRAPRVTSLTLKSVADGNERKIALPPNAAFGIPVWSHTGKSFAVLNTLPNGIELWIGDVASATVKRVPNVRINAAYGTAMQWMPDGATLLCATVPAGRGPAPAQPKAPVGPTVQESYGRVSPAPTYQDLLKNPFDEQLFEYYAASQLALVDGRSGKMTPVGKPAIVAEAEPSPDGRHVLVTYNHKPYTYLLAANAFPKEIEVWDMSGKVVHKVASLPLADQVPLEGVPTGPRNVDWVPTEPATLSWVEALDGGDPKRKVPHRDRVVLLKAPFSGQPMEMAKVEHRFAGLVWSEKNTVAMLRDFDRTRRWGRAFLVDPTNPSIAPKLVFDRSTQDRYNDPGTPVMKMLPNGKRVMRQNGDMIFLAGQGATPTGNRPFLDRFNLSTLKAERLFRCDEESYETFVAMLDPDGSRFITSYETPTTPPNYFLRTAADGGKKALTAFADPSPQLRKISKQLVTYKRADGVSLSFTLYLPPGYKPGERLPTIVWAYPIEFTDAGTAGQVSGSTKRFTQINGYSHLFLALMGYAVLDDATMPVVGDPETVNNTYVEQVVASAKAAIDKAVEMGVTDRNRVGVGGHSYGAFMTANLLAHSDLFRAGVARSGAYNRTLTPFGFQSERRTYWEAQETYLKLSPFNFADKLKEPILLIHGEADNNSGTFPIQSDRMYQALKGNGGNVRFVLLPHESHGYAARESVEHTLYEMVTWFDKYVKAAPAAPAQ